MSSANSFDDAPMRVRDTLPQTGHCRLHTPNSARNSIYQDDLKWRTLHKRPRYRSFIRPQYIDEFETWNRRSLPPLLSWVHVIELSAGFHLTYMLWRGPPFFNVNASTDFEIAAIVAECFRLGGVDREALAKWETDKREFEASLLAPPVNKTWGQP